MKKTYVYRRKHLKNYSAWNATYWVPFNKLDKTLNLVGIHVTCLTYLWNTHVTPTKFYKRLKVRFCYQIQILFFAKNPYVNCPLGISSWTNTNSQKNYISTGGIVKLIFVKTEVSNLVVISNSKPADAVPVCKSVMVGFKWRLIFCKRFLSPEK